MMVDPFDIRLPVKAAIAWSIIAEVFREHRDAADLRVIEIHPGGGQYHILRICRVSGEDGVFDGGSEQLIELNLKSGMMRGLRPGRDETAPWLRIWLTHDYPELASDVAIETMGLPVTTEPPNVVRRTFGCMLLAALLGAKALSIDYLDARMGFLDTSGEGGGVRPGLEGFVGLFPADGRKGQRRASRAADCWLLFRGHEAALIGVLRMDGVLSSACVPEEAHDLFPPFQGSGCMRTAVSEAQRILSL